MYWPILLACTALLTAAGWFTGRALSSSVPESTRHPLPPLATSSSSASRVSGSAIRSSASVQEIVDAVAKEIGHAPHGTEEIALRLFSRFRDLPTAEFASAIATVQSEGFADRQQLSQLLAGYWAERDLEAARGWLSGLPEQQRRQYAVPIVATWERTDPRGLLAWFEAQSDRSRVELGNNLAPLIVAASARIDPERGLRLIDEAFAPETHGELRRKLFETSATRAPKDAAARSLTRNTASRPRWLAKMELQTQWFTLTLPDTSSFTHPRHQSFRGIEERPRV